jgi:hypothetical protein
MNYWEDKKNNVSNVNDFMIDTLGVFRINEYYIDVL